MAIRIPVELPFWRSHKLYNTYILFWQQIVKQIRFKIIKCPPPPRELVYIIDFQAIVFVFAYQQLFHFVYE